MDPYSILGLNPSATSADIKAAWRRLARQHHPDRKGGSQEMMSQINSAYNLLMDAEARRRFDQGEPGEMPPLDMRAANALMQITFAGLTQSQVAYGVQNLHDFIKHHISNNLDNFRGKLKENEKLLERTRNQRQKFKFKVEGSPVEMVFDQVETGCQELIAKCREDIKVMERARELYAELVELADNEKAQMAAYERLAAKARGELSDGRPNPLLGKHGGF